MERQITKMQSFLRVFADSALYYSRIKLNDYLEFNSTNQNLDDAFSTNETPYTLWTILYYDLVDNVNNILTSS